MTQKLFLALMVSGSACLMCVSALAAINRPAEHEQGNTYEECAVECSEFTDAKGCQEFRQAHLICTEKKKSTWPIFTAQMLNNGE